MYKKQHGGARKGAGRPATGRTVKASSITMTPELWAKLDKIKKDKTRSAWIADKIKLTKES